MALTKPIGFLCYNNSELVRDGYIESAMSFQHDPDTFNINKLKRNRKGVSYQLKREDENDPTKITSVIETRRLLPAEKMKIEIQFGKTLKNAVTHPIAPGAIPGTIGGLVGNPLAGLGFGGITSGYTNFVYDIIDSKMLINEPIIITEEILDTGIIQLEKYPVSIFGIVREHTDVLGVDANPTIGKIINNYKEDHPQARLRYKTKQPSLLVEIEAYLGLDFQEYQNGDEIEKQTDRIGQHSRGSYQGGPRKRIDGATDSKGRFGEVGNPYLQIVAVQGDSGEPPEQEVVLFDDQSDLFIEIIRDFRKTKFRGDNRDAPGARHYPFENKDVDDITDKHIRINTSNLKIDDTIYITYCEASERRLRQAMRHKGIVGQGNTFGVSGWNLEIGSQMDVFDYQIREWIIPKAVPSSFNAPDKDFKITYNEFLDWKDTETNNELSVAEKEEYFQDRFRKIEGWRMSNVISDRLEYLWGADYRGIVLMVDRGEGIVVFPSSLIRDKEWFENYVKGLDFIEKHVDPTTGETIYDNLQVKIDRRYRKLEDVPESPVDIGSPANETLFDREKIPYYRPFALALQDVSQFDKDISDTGVGIPTLDVILKSFVDASGENAEELYNGAMFDIFTALQSAFLTTKWGDNDLKHADLSFSDFHWAIAQPQPSKECDEMPPISEHHYTCHTYDPTGGIEGSGIWLTKNYIENQIFEWRPPGGFIESYWKMDTPYFCGDFKRGTRIYIEKVGGNSLDNYSWVYVDTRPDVVDSISADKDIKTEKNYLSFYDNIAHNSLSYHVFSDAVIQDSLKRLDIDPTRNHEREFLDDEDNDSNKVDIHYEQMTVGYNNMLGDSPSFSQGKPIVNLESKMKYDGTDLVYNVDILGNSDYGLRFNAPIPTATNIPFYWSFKSMEIVFDIPEFITIAPKDASATLHFSDFEDNDSVVNNWAIQRGANGSKTTTRVIDCAYYDSEEITFLGKVWNLANIREVRGNVINEETLREFKIDEGQSSIVTDGQGKIFVFFADSISGNISVAVSSDDTKTWVIHRDVVRLLSNETASIPVVVQDSVLGTLHLFYVLNDAYLMHKRIDTKLFKEEDVWVSYVPPDTYDENSLDDFDNNQSSSLYNYTPEGKTLRQETSYFVIGDYNSNFIQDQLFIKDNITSQNHKTGRKQTIRYDCSGDEENMDAPYNGKAFTVNKDNEGIFRIFFIEESGFSVKASPDLAKWEYIGRNLPIHKTHFSDTIKEGTNPVITNIQIAKNYNDENTFNLFYFYNGMLLMRRLPPTVFKRGDEVMNSSIEVDESIESSRPLFIVGSIPDDILEERLEEIADASNGVVFEPEIAIIFPYSAGVLTQFDETMAVDDTTQVGAVVLREGDVRVMYKDSLGYLNAATIRGNTVFPEIFYKTKQGSSA